MIKTGSAELSNVCGALAAFTSWLEGCAMAIKHSYDSNHNTWQAVWFSPRRL